MIAALALVGTAAIKLSKSEALLVAHWAARIYDEATSALGLETCAGTYWRESETFRARSRTFLATRASKPGKRGRKPDHRARQCSVTKELRRGPGQGHPICNSCYVTYKRDLQDGLV